MPSERNLKTGILKGQQIMVDYVAAALSGLTEGHTAFGEQWAPAFPHTSSSACQSATNASTELEMTKKSVFRVICRATATQLCRNTLIVLKVSVCQSLFQLHKYPRSRVVLDQSTEM